LSDLNEREESVLKIIIEEYVKTSEPVGSRYISKSGPLKLSAASIRNIMSDLEDKGYLTQPHTSAGRIPSDYGYRYYIDRLVVFGSPDSEIISSLNEESRPASVNEFLKNFSRKMGSLTKSVGFVSAPKLNTMHLKHIEFLPFSPHTVLTIIVTKSGIVHNIMLNMEKPVDRTELLRVSNYLNEHFTDKTLGEVKQHILMEMEDRKEHLDKLFERVYSLGSRVFEVEDFGYEIYLEGTSNVLDMPEFKDVQKIKDIYRVFEEQHFISEVLDKCVNETGVQIFVGSEIGKEEINDLGLVSKTYSRGGKVVGSLGIIGPKRMSYPKVVSIVDCTSDIITKMLNRLGE
jgi:heat-inducible transcriptional repressor